MRQMPKAKQVIELKRLKMIQSGGEKKDFDRGFIRGLECALQVLIAVNPLEQQYKELQNMIPEYEESEKKEQER